MSLEGKEAAFIFLSGSKDECPESSFPDLATKGRNWTEEEDKLLREAVNKYSGKNWKKVATIVSNRTDVQCLHRWQKVLRPGLIKGPWTAEEDELVRYLVGRHGVTKWALIAKELPGRLGKQCRERWLNHLDPNLNKSVWTDAEDKIIFEQRDLYHQKWSEIARLLPGRSDNTIKNRWNSSSIRNLKHEYQQSLLLGTGSAQEECDDGNIKLTVKRKKAKQKKLKLINKELIWWLCDCGTKNCTSSVEELCRDIANSLDHATTEYDDATTKDDRRDAVEDIVVHNIVSDSTDNDENRVKAITFPTIDEEKSVVAYIGCECSDDHQAFSAEQNSCLSTAVNETDISNCSGFIATASSHTDTRTTNCQNIFDSEKTAIQLQSGSDDQRFLKCSACNRHMLFRNDFQLHTKREVDIEFKNVVKSRRNNQNESLFIEKQHHKKRIQCKRSTVSPTVEPCTEGPPAGSSALIETAATHISAATDFAGRYSIDTTVVESATFLSSNASTVKASCIKRRKAVPKADRSISVDSHVISATSDELASIQVAADKSNRMDLSPISSTLLTTQKTKGHSKIKQPTKAKMMESTSTTTLKVNNVKEQDDPQSVVASNAVAVAVEHESLVVFQGINVPKNLDEQQQQPLKIKRSRGRPRKLSGPSTTTITLPTASMTTSIILMQQQEQQRESKDRDECAAIMSTLRWRTEAATAATTTTEMEVRNDLLLAGGTCSSSSAVTATAINIARNLAIDALYPQSLGEQSADCSTTTDVKRDSQRIMRTHINISEDAALTESSAPTVKRGRGRPRLTTVRAVEEQGQSRAAKIKSPRQVTKALERKGLYHAAVARVTDSNGIGSGGEHDQNAAMCDAQAVDATRQISGLTTPAAAAALQRQKILKPSVDKPRKQAVKLSSGHANIGGAHEQQIHHLLLSTINEEIANAALVFDDDTDEFKTHISGKKPKFRKQRQLRAPLLLLDLKNSSI